MTDGAGAVRRGRLDRAVLYAISAEGRPERFLEMVPGLIRGGVEVVQLRQPQLAREEILRLAIRLQNLCQEAGALFIVNDHLDLALLTGADGVHLGASDLSPAAARRLAGSNLLIGASVATPAAARSAVGAGADYLGVGAVFATPVKAGRPVIGPSAVAAVAAAVSVPVFPIGGIDVGRIPQLRAQGLARACVIRALDEAADPEEAARSLRTALAGEVRMMNRFPSTSPSPGQGGPT